MQTVDALKCKYYSSDSYDGTVQFYNWVRQSIQKDHVIMAVGAGPTSDRKVRSLRGEAKQIIGVDLDDAVLKNTDLDQAFVVRNDTYPFPDNYFDMAVSDYVLEHVEHPVSFMREINRVLKPGAPFYFRTPNRLHYVSLISRTTPHWIHELVANRVRRLSEGAHEPYPVFHRLNSRRQIFNCARSVGFREIELKFIEAEPSYLVFHPIAFRMGVVYERLVNRYDLLTPFRANIIGCLIK